jgi:hypothetical protein
MQNLFELLTQLGNGLRRPGFGLGFLLREGGEGQAEEETGEDRVKDQARQSLPHM